MTDNEIIKALDCCKTNNCDECPFYGVKEDCEVELPEEAFDLINRQDAEIERLKAEIKKKQKTLDEVLELAEMGLAGIDEHDRIIKSEAIKEFAERLCNGRLSNDPVVIAVKAELKEIADENENV